MYHNKSLVTKTLYYLTPTFTAILLIIIVLLLSILAYYYIQKQNNFLSMTQRFSEYIYEYALDRSGISDAEVSSIISTFQFDSVMVPLSKTDATGTQVSNYDWNTNSEAFLDLIMIVQRIVVRSCQPDSIHYKNEVIWKMARHFISQVQARLPTKPKHHTFPWGENWYQFSISYPLFLVIVAYMQVRLFKTEVDKGIYRTLSLYIQNYFETPKDDRSGIISIGWTRDGPNAIMMAVPYIGGHLLLKDFDKKNNITKYINRYISLDFVTSGEGLYGDYGFVFHTVLRAYGYIYSSYHDIVLVSKFLEKTDYLKLTHVFERFEHPTIKRHFSAWFTRTDSVMSSATGGKLGFYVIDSICAVIAKTEDWMVEFNGQRETLCYYEADQNNYTWGQIWIGARVFFTENSDRKWYRDLVTYYPGVISFDNRVVEFKSLTSTTQTFMPSKGISLIVSMEDAVAIRNEYSIVYSSYTLDVIELTLLTKEGIHSYYEITPEIATHTAAPLTVSLNLGTFEAGKKAGGSLGEYYSFVDSHTYVYAESPDNTKADIIVVPLKHPDTGFGMSCLQIRPKLYSVRGAMRASFGYSTVRGSSVNSVAVQPSINFIRADGYTLHCDPKYPNFLWLYHGDEVVVTRQMNQKLYESSISISSTMLSQKFGKNFKIKEDMVLFGSDYRGPTNDRFQMLISGVTAPENETEK